MIRTFDRFLKEKIITAIVFCPHIIDTRVYFHSSDFMKNIFVQFLLKSLLKFLDVWLQKYGLYVEKNIYLNLRRSERAKGYPILDSITLSCRKSTLNFVMFVVAAESLGITKSAIL